MSLRAAAAGRITTFLVLTGVALLSVLLPSRVHGQALDIGTIGQLIGEIDRFRSGPSLAPPPQSVQRQPSGDQRSGAEGGAGERPPSPSETRTLQADDLAALREACRQPYERPLSESDLGVRFRFSRIEEDYCRRTGEVLFQFGYEMFEHAPASGELAIGAVSPDYVLGVGDEVTVLFTGQQPATYYVEVDRQGGLMIPGWPPVAAAGRTFGEVRREVEARTAATQIGGEVYISLRTIRSVAVYVLGEVKFPGRLQLTSLSSIIDALSLAGGVKKTGSLRRIHVQRGDTLFWLDAYELAHGGVSTHDLTIRDGDRVVVPPIGPTVAIGGEVKRPGIYELAEGQRALRLSRAIELAGGLLRPHGNRLLQVRYDDSGAERLVQQPDPQQTLGDGEILLVARSQDVRLGSVELVGHVRVPGRRSLAQSSTLSRLVGDINTFQDNPYLLFAALETTDPQTRARRLFPVSLQAVLEGRQDFTLRDGDRLIVLGREDVDFLSSREVLRLVAESGQPERLTLQENRQPSLGDSVAGTSPSSDPALGGVAALAQSLGQAASGDVVRRSGSGVLQTTKLDIQRDPESGKLIATDPDSGEEIELQKLLSEGIPCRGLERLAAIAATNSADRFRGTLRVIDVKTALPGVAPEACPPVYDSYPDLLPLAVEHVVAVTGAVRRPGGYPITQNTSATSVIAVAGGLARDVDLTRVEVSHVVPDPLQGVAADTRELIDLATNGADQVMVGPGDVLRFHSVFTDRDKGPVMLSGEFVRPGVYDIRRGERLSEAIRRAGGLTEQAYPYGAVFTRESVKLAQERGFRRAARELNSALALAAARGDISPNALYSVQVISSQLSSVEALGRVVTESDPTVLQVRPELDVVLEPGDRVFVPKRPSFVTVIGDVLNPGALQFVSGTTAEQYIRQAGGFQASADEDRVFVVYPNGVAEPLSVSVWNYNPAQIPPGASIVVPKDPAPFDFVRFLREGSSIVSQLAVAAASLAVISRN